MTRINVDAASPAIKKFIRSLAIDANGVEITLGGEVVCKIVPPTQFSDVEWKTQLAELGRLLKKARTHSKRLPADVVEGKIRNALKTVRTRG